MAANRVSVSILMILSQCLAAKKFCTEKGLFTPTISVRNGRQGPMVARLSGGPSTYTLKNESNLFVCINGPAYVYQPTEDVNGNVIERAVFFIFTHQCAPYNRLPYKVDTNASLQRGDQVNAIRLLGVNNTGDYRTPHLDLVPVNVFNPQRNVSIAGYSVFVSGSSRCTIQKGAELITLRMNVLRMPSYCIREFTGGNSIEDKILTADSRIRFVSCGAPVVAGQREIVVSHCVDYPDLEEVCEYSKPSVPYTCNMLQVIRQKSATTKDLGWRSQVIDAIEKIFTTACTSLNPKLVRSITSITKYYWSEWQKVNPSTGDKHNVTKWKTIVGDLERCAAAGPTLRIRKDVYTTTSVVCTGLKYENRIRHFHEEAENDFEFNWALDFHWRMFATVYGVCSSFAFSHYYRDFVDSYQEDFLVPLNSTWVDSFDNELLIKFLGGFAIKKSTDDLKDCMEGSFMDSGTTKNRLLRPVFIFNGVETNSLIERLY